MNEFEQITQAEQWNLQSRVMQLYKNKDLLQKAVEKKYLSKITPELTKAWNESVQIFKEINAHIEKPLDEISTARLISDSSSAIIESTLNRHISNYSVLNTVPIVFADGDVEELDMFKWKIGKIFFLKQINSNITE